MKRILLTHEKYTLVDNKDYKWLNKWKWMVIKSYRTDTFYAVRKEWKNGKTVSFAMHREILGLKHGDGILVDHKDRDGLNNQRYNLRKATKSLNAYNCKMQKHNTSGFRGVIFHKPTNTWNARIQINGKQISHGYHKNIEDAAKAYDKMAIKYRGKNATRLNFPLKRRKLRYTVANRIEKFHSAE